MYIDDQTGALIEARVLVAHDWQHQIDVQGLLCPAERADPSRPTGGEHEIHEPCEIRGRQPPHQAERRRAHLLHRAQHTLDRWQPVPIDAADDGLGHLHGTRRPARCGQRGHGAGASLLDERLAGTSVRRQPPRTVRERPRPAARMGTGLSSAPPQSSDSPTHMIQSVDASASQTRHRSCAHRVAVPGSRPLARYDAARPAHSFAWPHAHRGGAAAQTSTRRQRLRGGDRATSAHVYVDLADVERALDHRRARCEERTPVATEGERFRRARGATIPAKRAAKLSPRPRDTRVSVLSFRSYWARSMPLMWVQCRSARSPSCSWDRP